MEMAKDLMIRSSTEEFLIFKINEKESGIQVRYENENLWMTQKAMSEPNSFAISISSFVEKGLPRHIFIPRRTAAASALR